MLDVDFHPEVMAQGTRGLQPLGCISNPQPVKNGEVKQAKKTRWVLTDALSKHCHSSDDHIDSFTAASCCCFPTSTALECSSR